MLMPPQQPQSTNTPPPPGGQFDFMLKDPPKVPRDFRFITNLSRPLKILILVVLVIILLIAISFIANRGKGTIRKDLVDVMARSQEIVRVSKLIDRQIKDPETLTLASTTETTISSTQSRLEIYMKKAKIKYSPKELAVYLSKKTDQDMQTASQNNDLEPIYLAYLNKSLKSYQSALQTAAKDTKLTAVQSILNDSFSSNDVILSSALIKKLGT